MSNRRRVRRSLSLSAVIGLGSVIPIARPIVANAEPETPSTDAAVDARPTIWTGRVPGATADSMVVVHATASRESLQVGETADLVVVGRSEVAADGTATVHADPSDWYHRLAVPTGRVRLVITASADGGRRIGMALADVELVEDEATKRWRLAGPESSGLDAEGAPTESGTSSSASAGASVSPNGEKRTMYPMIDMNYRRYRLNNCNPSGQPPTVPPTGTSIYTLEPYRWMGIAIYFGAPSSIPGPTAYSRTIAPNTWIGRSSGVSSTVSSSAEVNVGGALLSASVSYATRSGSGTTISRKWENNSANPKHVDGIGGDPQFSGVSQVLGR